MSRKSIYFLKISKSAICSFDYKNILLRFTMGSGIILYHRYSLPTRDQVSESALVRCCLYSPIIYRQTSFAIPCQLESFLWFYTHVLYFLPLAALKYSTHNSSFGLAVNAINYNDNSNRLVYVLSVASTCSKCLMEAVVQLAFYPRLNVI